MGLRSRASSTCNNTGFQSCNHPGIPSSFCCPSNFDCVSFNNAASVVCCPSGQDCKTIAPLTCDITQQNATLHPTNQLHSIDLGGTLEKCGGGCCPKGFSCSNNQCVMKTSAAASSAPVKSSSAPTGTSTVGVKASSTSPPDKTATEHHDKFPVGAVLAGFFPGLLLGILCTILAIICLGRRRRNQASKRASSDFGSIAATVSDPIYNPDNNAFRTDFLRRESRSNKRTSRVRSLFSRSPITNDSGGAAHRGFHTPVRTPEMRKEPSTESIKIYSPPNGGLGRPTTTTTTFADMLEHAGMRDGEPYLASPAKIDPRTRNRAYS